jgi:hypothetical protein
MRLQTKCQDDREIILGGQKYRKNNEKELEMFMQRQELTTRILYHRNFKE